MIVKKEEFIKPVKERKTFNKKENNNQTDSREKKDSVEEFLENNEEIIWKSKSHTKRMAKSIYQDSIGEATRIFIMKRGNISLGETYNVSSKTQMREQNFLIVFCYFFTALSLIAIPFIGIPILILTVSFSIVPTIMIITRQINYRKIENAIQKNKFYVLTDRRLLIFEKAKKYALEQSIIWSEIKNAEIKEYYGTLKEIGCLLIHLYSSDIMLIGIENVRDICGKLNRLF